MKTKNSAYLVLTIIFVILSVIGGYFLYQIATNSKTSPQVTIPEVTPIPTNIPTITLVPIASASPTASSSSKVSPTPTKIATPTATPTKKVTPTAIPTKNETDKPTSTLITYKSDEDGFTVQHLSTRKVYQDTEDSGQRYTFYLYGGNFAIHVSSNDQWAWVTPDRNFSGNFLVSGQNTYRYDISTQTIVDIQYNGKNYTLQCIHNGKTSLKTECEEFISSFQFF